MYVKSQRKGTRAMPPKLPYAHACFPASIVSRLLIVFFGIYPISLLDGDISQRWALLGDILKEGEKFDEELPVMA